MEIMETEGNWKRRKTKESRNIRMKKKAKTEISTLWKSCTELSYKTEGQDQKQGRIKQGQREGRNKSNSHLYEDP